MKKIPIILALLIFISFVNTGDAIFDNCLDINCHNRDTFSGYPAINTSVLIFGFHRDINITDGVGNISISDCSTCHYNVSKMFDPGFTVATYTCEDCHILNRIGIVPPDRIVHNHIPNGSTNISLTKSSCGDCHNKTANLSRYSANASAAHYGRNASFGLSPGAQYCAYCHVNSSTIYRDVMKDQNNRMIGNHTDLPRNPDCPNCHNSGRIHDGTLTKPALTLPNSSFCQTCHASVQKHNNTVNCTQCHLKTNKNIHPVQYLQPDGTFKTNSPGNKTSAVNCPDCHQGAGPFNAPIIPGPLNHSSNSASGGLWNGTQPEYWDNRSQVSACYYCHGKTLHNKEPLGNVSNIRAGNTLNQSITNASFWCANCHYQGVSARNYSYNLTFFTNISSRPPEIQNKSGFVPAKASDGTSFFNHSLGNFSDNYSDATCVLCHGVNSPATTALFIHNVGPGGGGPDCISCHDLRVPGGAPADKKIDVTAFNKSVHNGLNTGGNAACWACHGDGTRPTGHPMRYKSPKKCSNDECHSLDQQFRAPMIYSHFRNASLNDNPTGAFNHNVTTSIDCQDCHINSVNSQGKNINSTVSHFASSDLFDSINCIYCHTNDDNSKKWGNATLIYKNRTTLVELDRENNRFIAREGETIDLGPIFSLRVLQISSVRESALIELIKENVSVDESLIGIGNYTYEEYLTIDNGSSKVPVIVINVTGIFKGNANEKGFIQFGGFRLKRVHPENKSTSCIACHVNASPKIKYRVIERVSNEKDEIFYSRETVNFTDKNIFNETTVLGLLAGLTNTDLHVNIQPEKRRALYEGETWDISDDTSLTLKAVDTKSEVVFLQLRTGDYFYEDLVKRGCLFEFNETINYLGNQPKNITLFRATVTGIVQGASKNMAVIEDAVALSPEIKKIEVNQTIAGYNTSWLWENSTINIGKIPENFHSPQVFDGANGGSDCLSCHGKDGFSEKKVLSLGKHDLIDGGGNNACYACHGGTKDIKSHPSGFKTPRDCLSCHASTQDNYSAVYIGDEEHRFERCVACHVSNIHEITALHVTPSVKQISLAKEDNRTILKATATAGYKMRLRAARYYIDSPTEKISMSPVDGTFDSQMEDVFAEINVSKLSPGKHIVYVEAMERQNNWGVPSSLEFTIENGSLKPQETKNSGMPLMADIATAFLIVFVLRRRGKI